MVQLRGIDLSDRNGKPDFDKIKADGIQFAMIRMGYGSDIASQDDKEFERNVSECERVGLPWGSYLYSYALNTTQAKSELEHAKRLLKGKNPKYPVVFDMEDADEYKRKNGMPSDAVLVDICDTFLSGIESAGYKPMLYASLDWLENQLNDPKLDKYDKWVAQWSSACTYKKSYTMWQYTNDGKVNGVETRVDMDNCFVDYLGEQHVTMPTFNSPAPSQHKEHKVIDVVKKIIEKIVHHKIRYSVKPNETLSEIAQKFNTNVDDIVKENHIKDPNLIRIGQMLTIIESRKVKVNAEHINTPYPGHLYEVTNPLTHDGNVKKIQHALNLNGANIKEDGWYGDNTKNAVMEFQRKHGLVVDGVIGKNSWEKLF